MECPVLEEYTGDHYQCPFILMKKLPVCEFKTWDSAPPEGTTVSGHTSEDQGKCYKC